MSTPTRLQVLEHAREIAEAKGAVIDGRNWAEADDKRALSPYEIRETPGEVCRVCVAGAIMLAQIEQDADCVDPWRAVDEAVPFAERVLGNEAGDYACAELTYAITDKGTPYVLAVLDAMIEAEKAVVA